MFAETSQLPMWTEVIERFGVSVLLILFGCLIIWKLLPHVIRWIKTSTAQSEAVSESVPRLERSLEDIADCSRSLKEAAGAAERTEKKTESILKQGGRIETATTRIFDEVRRQKP